MTEKQVKEYEKLSKLKEQYEKFIAQDGDVAIVNYSVLWHDFVHRSIGDDEFKEIVKNIAKERLENINKQIEEL